MGFFDRIKESAKDITGIGLSAEEQYQRAYTKGVFLQPPDYRSAAENFHDAEKKFREEGDVRMANHARANGYLYKFYAKRDPGYIDEVIHSLKGIPRIERIGSDREMIDTRPMIQELRAFQMELNAGRSSDSTSRTAFYKKASDLYFKMGSKRFTFIDRFNVDGPKDSAVERGYYNMALADYWDALEKLRTDPDDARNMMQKSLSRFKQSRDQEWAGRADDYMNRLKVSRHCWMCQREVRGEDIYYKHYPSDVVPYHEHLIRDLKQDPGMLENEGSITVCTACGSMIEKQADIYAEMRAKEVKNWAEQIFDRHSREIDELRAEISSLRSDVHTASFH